MEQTTMTEGDKLYNRREGVYNTMLEGGLISKEERSLLTKYGHSPRRIDPQDDLDVRKLMEKGYLRIPLNLILQEKVPCAGPAFFEQRTNAAPFQRNCCD